MTHRPQFKNKYAHMCLLISLFIVCILIIMQNQFGVYRWIFQIGILILSVVALQVLLKYILSDYVYELTDSNLKIFRIQGKKSTCVGSLLLNQSICKLMTKSEYLKIKKQVTISINYCKNLFPEDYMVYYFEFNNKKTALLFEPDEVFANQLNKKINELKGEN